MRETGAGSYPELGEAIFGRGGAVLVEIFQWSGYYLTGVVQIAFTGAAWDQTFRNWAWARPICTDQWMLITTAVLLPLMQVPSFTQFGKLALLASIVTLYATGVYLGQILDKGQYRAGHGAVPGVSIPCYDQWTSASMLASKLNAAGALAPRPGSADLQYDASSPCNSSPSKLPQDSPSPDRQRSHHMNRPALLISPDSSRRHAAAGAVVAAASA